MRSPGPGQFPALFAYGFTVVELMVSVAVLGLVGAVVFTTSQSSWRRERANAATVELSGWLEQISKSPEQNGSSCRVVLNTGTLASGAVLASVTPATCAIESNLLLPAINTNESFQVAVTGAATIGGVSQWWFTPRGAISTTTPAATAGSSTADISVRISVAGTVPVRCVRLSGTLGLLRMGRNNATGDPNVNCTDWSVR